MAGCGAHSVDAPAQSNVDPAPSEAVAAPQDFEPATSTPLGSPTAEASLAQRSESDAAAATGDARSTQDSFTPIEPTEAAPQTRAPIEAVDPELEAAAELEQELAEFVVPPAWLESVNSSWDRSKPWQEARLEIRRLLGIGDQASRREGLRLMWDYRQSNNMGDGHEYSMYTYLGGEPLWAILACRELLDREEHAYPPDFGIKSLASLYLERGMLGEAEKTLQRGLDWPPADATWRRAEYLDLLGDLYVAWGKPDEARNYYEQSIQLYPRTNPPYGQHLIPRRIKVIQSKLDILSMNSLEDVVLRDGTWSATVPGYSGDIHVTAQVSQGRLAVIRLRHEEKIDQGATITVPEQIVERQSLTVDAVTGATISKDAIVTGTLNALREAGLP